MNTRKTQSTEFTIQSVKINFILLKSCRSIDNTNDFYFVVKNNIEFSFENLKPGCKSQKIAR